MTTPDIQLSRISKLFVDRDEMNVEDALARRQSHGVTLVCGSDVASSYTLQLAVLTAANIATRCFPGAVRVSLHAHLAETPLLLWPVLNLTFGQALMNILGPKALTGLGSYQPGCHAVVFGNAVPPIKALRVTFDGWIAKVGPACEMERLTEREYCSVSGILAAALAMSEIFLSFADFCIEAGRRTVALSLWQPDADVRDPSALGVPAEFLPGDLWVLGLGHLGNAYLWALATLPYANPRSMELFLNDFDKVASENLETSLIFRTNNVGSYKTRVCSAWLEQRGFKTRIIERRFHSDFRCHTDEPQLALCGFDSNSARRHLATAEFTRVIESGLGGMTSNFDTISLHSLPNPRRAVELWPDVSPEEVALEQEHRARVARESAAYARLHGDECGRVQLAEKAIAVPFVGAAAASLVVAESIRLLHGGAAYTDFKMGLVAPAGGIGVTSGNYGAHDLAGLTYRDSQAPTGHGPRTNEGRPTS
ncbi:MAG TPA: ThiF family adenylyltransferase [Candidatus Polarisedimenticolaceae bacterium]|nr:ThiF family adenylyltransferase [Candidatus Polarisedimenticolaceae bacterium]